MSAQKELVELLDTTDNRAGAWQFEAQNWVRDHGPAIAELIEACAAGLKFHWYMEPESRQSHLRLTEAIRKLTEPKA